MWERGQAVGTAVHLTAADTAAGQRYREAIRVMVASGIAVDFGSAAEVAHHDDQRLIQPPALGEVFQQCRSCPVENRQHCVLQAVEVVSVRVPMVPFRAVQVTRRANH